MTSLLKTEDFEILIATKNKSSLAFLEAMFPFTHFSNFNVLIVNQSNQNVLTSNFATIRVININEKGLSKSRNLAINNAIKPICLIADDDVVYLENFDKDIIKEFNSITNASVITFNHQRIGLAHPQNNDKAGYRHNKKTIMKVCSVEIVFKLDDIKKSGVCFDDYFGLGSYFETGEEFLFLRNLLKVSQKMYYNPKVILYHPLISSGECLGADRIVYARAALSCKLYGFCAYLWLLKYVVFLYRHKFMGGDQWNHKIKIGLSGISKYKELEKEKIND